MSSQAIWRRIRVLFIAGAIITLGAFMLIGRYIDTNGILHEPFFLMPHFWVLSLGSIITAVIVLIVRRRR